MYKPENCAVNVVSTTVPEFKPFSLKDRDLFETYSHLYDPVSCEYNFANLFAWQVPCHFSWALYQDRILIHDANEKTILKPYGKPFNIDELALLSLQLQAAGLSPDISLFTKQDLEQFPGVEQYYRIKPMRDHAEYLYDVHSLATLTGVKLHKKRNLISQFVRAYPEYEIKPLSGDCHQKAFDLAGQLMNQFATIPKTLAQEYQALQASFENFEALDLEGLVLCIKENVIAFSIFSRINETSYDIQFEKSDMNFKGAAQVINQETAKYLENRCMILNREQDLGIKGLRQAKLSYEPCELFLPHTLVYDPKN